MREGGSQAGNPALSSPHSVIPQAALGTCPFTNVSTDMVLATRATNGYSQAICPASLSSTVGFTSPANDSICYLLEISASDPQLTNDLHSSPQAPQLTLARSPKLIPARATLSRL